MKSLLFAFIGMDLLALIALVLVFCNFKRITKRNIQRCRERGEKP